MSAVQPCQIRSRSAVRLLLCGVLSANAAGCTIVGPNDNFGFVLALQTDQSEYVADAAETI